MTAPVRFPRFFVTSPAPCPYLAGRTERKVFTELKGPHADQLNEALGRIGFRRSQTVAYRPSCVDCQACVSVRVVAGEFAPSKAQKRILKRNSDLVVTECRPWATSEQFESENEERSGLGNYIILDHIRRAAEEGIPYVYLGYWVEGSARMQYKIRYRPLERLGPRGWRRLGSEEQDRLIREAVGGDASAGSTGRGDKALAVSR